MDGEDLFKRMDSLDLGNKKEKNIFSYINPNQDDEENEIIVIGDEKTELSQIKELDNDSRSVTECEYKSVKGSQLNLRENINLNEEKKDDEFLRPHDIKINNRNENNINNIMNNCNNNKQLDFEDLVNKKYGLFPII